MAKQIKKGNTTRKFLRKKPLKCKIETHYILNKVFKTVKSNMKTMFFHVFSTGRSEKKAKLDKKEGNKPTMIFH